MKKSLKRIIDSPTHVLLLMGLLFGCTAASRPLEPERGVATFRNHCEHLESTYFGSFDASGLAGRALVSIGDEQTPLPGLQVAARSEDGSVSYAITARDGTFNLPALKNGDYDVWTCLDGYDEVRFRLNISTTLSNRQFELFVGPAEAGGRRDVRALR